jgi:Icc-related predicted phosphoesterase
MRNRGFSISKVWKGIPENLDLLITHGPPHGILDTAIRDNMNVGCEELLKAIKIKKPKNHVFGHIHYFGGQKFEENGIKFYNASICDENYEPTNKITEFEI